MALNRTEHKLTSPPLRLNGVCPYFTMFKLSVPQRIISRHRNAKIVLDPFCGRGTSLYAARLHGRESIGIDNNPVAVAISRAKVAPVDQSAVERLLHHALDTSPSDVPEGEFWDLAFSPKTLRQICSIREYLSRRTSASAALLRAIMLGTLHGPQSHIGSYFSNQMPRTYATKPDSAVRFWRRNGLLPRQVDVRALTTRKIRYFLAEAPASHPGHVIAGNALKHLSNLDTKADLVITSPPYMGLRTYIADQWLRLWFLGGPPSVTYRWPDQIGVESHERFSGFLRSALTGLAKATTDDAHAYLLLGSIPSIPVDVPALMRQTLQASDSNWRLVSTRNCGPASAGHRQAKQFGPASVPSSEFMFHLAKGP
jgi:hypothetical protein